MQTIEKPKALQKLYGDTFKFIYGSKEVSNDPFNEFGHTVYICGYRHFIGTPTEASWASVKLVPKAIYGVKVITTGNGASRLALVGVEKARVRNFSKLTVPLKRLPLETPQSCVVVPLKHDTHLIIHFTRSNTQYMVKRPRTFKHTKKVAGVITRTDKGFSFATSNLVPVLATHKILEALAKDTSLQYTIDYPLPANEVSTLPTKTADGLAIKIMYETDARYHGVVGDPDFTVPVDMSWNKVTGIATFDKYNLVKEKAWYELMTSDTLVYNKSNNHVFMVQPEVLHKMSSTNKERLRPATLADIEPLLYKEQPDDT